MKDYPEAQEILQSLGRKRLMEAKNASKMHRAQGKLSLFFSKASKLLKVNCFLVIKEIQIEKKIPAWFKTPKYL